MQQLPLVKKGIYQHYKGGRYEVLDVVRHSETTEPMVLYRHLDDDGGTWVRPYTMFFEEIEKEGKKVPRFAFMSEIENSPVYFYEPEYYIFSNFSAFKLDWKGRDWMTSEHAYHSEKFTDEQIKDALYDTRSAHDALNLSHQHKDAYRKDWDEVKLGIMKQILHAKALQHPYVMKKLLDSGDRELVENSWRDDFWGWGPNKDGNNHLGKLWMQVRDEVRSEARKQK